MGASGRTTIDFGAFPGAYEASVDVTGQSGIVSGSDVEAWIEPDTTTDHSPDEHMVEQLRVFADRTSIIAGTGFTIRGFAGTEVPSRMYPIVGKFNVGWAWN